MTIEYQYQDESLCRYRDETNWKLSPALPRTHSRSCQLLLFFKRSSWNTNRYHPKETALVAIQYSCQMNSNESLYQVDPGADPEETWETAETESECKHTTSQWLKTESFHLRMCAQAGVRSIRSHAELKSFGAGSWGSFCHPRIQKTETGGRPWVWVQPSLRSKFHDSLCQVVRYCLIA